MRFSHIEDLFHLETAVQKAARALDAATLRSITAQHYYRDEDPHANAEIEYSGELQALAARDLVRAIEALPESKRPVGWDAEVAS